MDKHVVGVLLSFLLYVGYVLLPLIPAILLYRMFPNSQISASGVLSNFKFNATGAFGSYVITVFLGWGLVHEIHGQIVKVSNPSWTIKAKLNVLDKSGNLISNHNRLGELKIKVFPELVQVRGNNVIIKLPGLKSTWSETMLEFHLPGHGMNVIDLAEASAAAEIDVYNLTMSIIEPIKIRKSISDPIIPISGGYSGTSIGSSHMSTIY